MSRESNGLLIKSTNSVEETDEVDGLEIILFSKRKNSFEKLLLRLCMVRKEIEKSNDKIEEEKWKKKHFEELYKGKGKENTKPEIVKGKDEMKK